MTYYAGVDVSLEQANVCVVDGDGAIVREGTVASEPEAMIGWFKTLELDIERIGLEAGPLSQWLYAAMKQAGLKVELIETRHVRTAFKIMPVKTDRKDARGIAQLMRLGWFRPVHCKTAAAQEVRAELTARKLIQINLHRTEMSLRGIVRNFGLKVGKVSKGKFEGRIRGLIAGNPTLERVADAMLSVRRTMARELAGMEKHVRSVARNDRRVRLLMTAPGVGTITALAYVAAIDEPARFKSSRTVGAHFGLTPRRYKSGETDRSGHISKIGDASVRSALYEAANVILSRSSKASSLKDWAKKISRRRGAKSARIALARKLAVVLHRMWIDGTPFRA
jgi:transposase